MYSCEGVSKGIPCQGTADRINQALTEALGKPFPPSPDVSPISQKTEQEE